MGVLDGFKFTTIGEEEVPPGIYIYVNNLTCLRVLFTAGQFHCNPSRFQNVHLADKGATTLTIHPTHRPYSL